MKVLFDTNTLSDLLKHDSAATAIAEKAEEVHLPFISLGEIKGGFLRGTRAAANEALLLRILQEPGVEVAFADSGTIEAYARIYLYLRRAGKPIPTNDIWIAALALQHGYSVVTRNRHFDHIPQVVRAPL